LQLPEAGCTPHLRRSRATARLALKRSFREAFSVDELASEARMSVSVLHSISSNYNNSPVLHL
jgi:hypothetical protein